MPIWKTLESRLKTPKNSKKGEYVQKLPLSPYKQRALKYTGGSIFRALNVPNHYFRLALRAGQII
jgi:hypothetical protein